MGGYAPEYANDRIIGNVVRTDKPNIKSQQDDNDNPILLCMFSVLKITAIIRKKKLLSIR